MKKLAYSTACGFLLLFVCGFFCSCKKDDREDKQRADIEKYITNTLKKPIDEQDGVYFVLLDTSPIPDTLLVRVKANDVVEFEYLAWSLNGAVFATSDNSLAEQNGLQPTPAGKVRVGSGALIAGLDRGLQRMMLGDHGIILFPFTLGYGEEYVGQVKPESALIFEVWVTRVNEDYFP